MARRLRLVSRPRLPPDLLSDFHAARAGLYRAAFELVREPPGLATLSLARELVSQALQLRPGLSALESALAPSARIPEHEEHSRLLALAPRCADPACAPRSEAFAAAALPAVDERAGELGVLWTLAERTTEAIVAGSLPEAAILVDVQGRFLVSHAGACLGVLSARLREAGGPLYSQVGSALASLIEEDLRLLGYPDTPA